MLISKLNTNILWPFVILIIALTAIFTKPWVIKPAQTISTSVQGSSKVTPTIAKIMATITTQNVNLDQARKQNEQKVSSLIGKLKELGIDQKDIKTQSFSAGPGYQIESFPVPPKTNTNEVSNSLEITIRNFDNADAIVAALTQNGASNLYGPNLTVDEQDLETAKSEARQSAVESAKKKGQELAKASDRKLGKVIKIQEQGDFTIPSPIMARGSMDLKEKANQIQPGQEEITINLLVDFELK